MPPLIASGNERIAPFAPGALVRWLEARAEQREAGAVFDLARPALDHGRLQRVPERAEPQLALVVQVEQRARRWRRGFIGVEALRRQRGDPEADDRAGADQGEG